MIPKKSHHKAKVFITVATGGKIEEPPSYLGPIGRVCFQKIVADLIDMGVADRADTKAVEAFASAYEEYRKAREPVLRKGFTMQILTKDGKDYEMVRPEVNVMNSAWARMRSLLGELYMTPASRMKAPGGGTVKAEKDPWEGILPDA